MTRGPEGNQRQRQANRAVVSEARARDSAPGPEPPRPGDAPHAARAPGWKPENLQAAKARAQVGPGGAGVTRAGERGPWEGRLGAGPRGAN